MTNTEEYNRVGGDKRDEEEDFFFHPLHPPLDPCSFSSLGI
jgi:hypothetical protein